jgi:hypothetical protein
MTSQIRNRTPSVFPTKKRFIMPKTLNFKLVFCLIAIVLCFYRTEAQVQIIDRIFKTDSTVYSVLIKKIKKDSVTYQYYGQTHDSIFSIPKSEVAKIIFKNGTSHYYSEKEKDRIEVESSSFFYFDASAGIGLGVFLDASAGYRITQKHAIGVSVATWNELSICCAHEAKGFGLQWRFTPTRTSLIKLELGYVRSALYGDDGPYFAVYNHQKSNKRYQRVSVARRFDLFSLGLTLAETGGQINDNFDYNTKKLLNTSVFTVGCLVLHIGLIIQ